MEPRSILQQHSHNEWHCPDWKMRLGCSAGFAVSLLIVFHELLGTFVERWANEPQYQHGFAIPLIASWLGWFLKDRIKPDLAESSTKGLAWIIAGLFLHVLSRYLFVEFGDCLAFLFCLLGGIQLIWGTHLVVGIWPAILFLVFMFPLPFRIERMLSAPLQLMGAEQSAYYIQACGIPAMARGSMILMGEHKLGVAEACSGMRMLTVFLAISAATVIVSRRTVWEKALILLSAIPIALICNIARIVATALAHTWFGQKTADLVFHDLSGWLMMPAAMVLLYLELKLLDWLFVPVAKSDSKIRNVNPFGIPTTLRPKES